MKMTLKSLALMLALSTPLAQATVDANDRVHLVVADINSEETTIDYMIERAPIIGCYGVEQGARLYAWVTEYKATQNVGCGGTPIHEDINALSCAKVLESKESDDFYSFSEITLDISKCQDKNNPAFVKAIQASARKNFPQKDKKKSVVLKLVK